jgi:hypothetical protein
MLAVRNAIPKKEPLAKAEFATIRERLIKIGARVIEHAARIRIQLPTNCPERWLFRVVALSGARVSRGRAKRGECRMIRVAVTCLTITT